MSLQVSEVLGGDNVSIVVTPYCGPYEGLAFAKANGKADLFVWKDYTTPFLREGKLCKTEKEIESLEIPDHRKVEPWPMILEATAILREKTGMGGFLLPV